MIDVKLAKYKGCRNSKKRYFIAHITYWKKSGECIQRYSICYSKPGLVSEEHWHFNSLKAAQYFLDNMADERGWRYIGEHEEIREYEFYAPLRRFKAEVEEGE